MFLCLPLRRRVRRPRIAPSHRDYQTTERQRWLQEYDRNLTRGDVWFERWFAHCVESRLRGRNGRGVA